jgi:hypothetical protein
MAVWGCCTLSCRTHCVAILEGEAVCSHVLLSVRALGMRRPDYVQEVCGGAEHADGGRTTEYARRARSFTQCVSSRAGGRTDRPTAARAGSRDYSNGMLSASAERLAGSVAISIQCDHFAGVEALSRRAEGAGPCNCRPWSAGSCCAQ